MALTITFKDIDTTVTFNGRIDWEKYIYDASINVAQMIDDLQPSLNVWLYPPRDMFKQNKSEQHQELRTYIEEQLGYTSIKGKMRIWDHRGNGFRVWCKDRETFMRLIRLFKDTE